MDSENIVMLSGSVHKNYIDYDISEETLSKLLISFDGTIMGFDKSLIDGVDESNIILQKLGYKKDEIPKSISSLEDLKAILVYLKE